MNELDIAEFAQNILQEDVQKGKPVQFAADQAPQAPDVSDVEVPDDFAAQMVSEGLWSKAGIEVKERAPQTIQPKPKPKPQVPLTEETVYKQHLIKEYEKKVEDLKELVALMESFGMVGGDAGAYNSVGRNGTGSSEGRSRRKTTKKKKRKKAWPY